jgi:AcrR family transcriptional regulator
MPNRATGLEWDAGDPARDELVDAALAVAGEDGLEGLSIRRVAARLGLRPMSVYSHVASKGDLLALMFDRVSAEMLLPEPLPGEGRESIRWIARRSYDVYLAHPWMLHAFGNRPAPGPSQERRAGQSAAAMAAMGVAPEHVWTALGIVHEWTMGHALHVVTLREDPALAERVARVAPGARTEAVFDEALEAVLDGIEARFGNRTGPG